MFCKKKNSMVDWFLKVVFLLVIKILDEYIYFVVGILIYYFCVLNVTCLYINKLVCINLFR